MKHRNERAFSLTELLVCIGIIVVLSGLIFPILISARNRANTTVELSHLRQLGQAAAIYVADFNEWPTGTPQLVPNYAPKSIVVSPADTTLHGHAQISNDYINGLLHLGLGTDYRRTCIGYYDMGWQIKMWHACNDAGPNSGWLISMTPAKLDRHLPLILAEGNYRRLLVDGSVRMFPLRRFGEQKGVWFVGHFVDVGEQNVWNPEHPECELQY